LKRWIYNHGRIKMDVPDLMGASSEGCYPILEDAF
jgi:hypothetical protein